MLKMYTTRIGGCTYQKGSKLHGVTVDDMLDITVKSADRFILCLAPTWEMVMGVKNRTITEEEYTRRYLEILDKSRVEHPEVWDWMINKDKIVFACYCNPGDFCHRKLLAKYLVKMGVAQYVGEI